MLAWLESSFSIFCLKLSPAALNEADAHAVSILHIGSWKEKQENAEM